MHAPGVLDVDGGRIAWAGPPDAAPALPAGAAETRLPGLVMPGFVDTHCHTPMTLFRGASEDVALDRFLREILWPREAKLTEEDVFAGMALGCAEHLRAGTTTTCEMYVFEDAIAAAVREAGLRCLLTPGVIEAPGWDYIGPWIQRLEAVLAFHDRLDGSEETIEVGIAAHAAYSLPLEALEAIAAAARERDALVHVHVAETRSEGAELEERHGKSVPALLDDIGFLDGRVLAAHGVWLSEADRALFRERDVAIAHCPTANAKLASGIAPLAHLVAHGLRVGLGTDSPAANNDFDMWEEMRLAALLARATTGDAEAFPAAQVVALATRRGGEALGRSDLGALGPGGAADFVHVRTDDAAFVPLVDERDVVSHLVWSASSRLVADVWVAGRRVVEDGVCTTVDEERLRAEVQERALRLAHR
ncbi:MAG: amidohydrolase [Actinomycetota bacterium]|nr:amidohydrolase [Actinomycetota bacterium]